MNEMSARCCQDATAILVSEGAGAKFDLLSSCKIWINPVLGIHVLISTGDIQVIVQEILRARFLIGHF